MKGLLRVSAAVSCAVALVACGGGGGSSNGGSGGGGTGGTGSGGGGSVTPGNPTYDLHAGISNMVTKGLSANITMSGTVTSNGQTASFTGTGTYTLPAGTSGATFNTTAAISQAESITGQVTVAGQTQQVNTSNTNYYASASSSYSFLGEVEAVNGQTTEYDVASTAFQWPTSIQGGTSDTLGTVLRYSDSTQSQSIGSSQTNYSVTAATTTNGPLGVKLTTLVYDTNKALIETDTRQYTLSSASVLTFVSYSTQTQDGTLTATATQ